MKSILLALALLAPIAIAEDAQPTGMKIVNFPYTQTTVAGASVAIVTVSSTPIMLLPARLGRLKVILFNEKETLYVKAGAGASISDYTWRVPAATSLEITAYVGALTGVLGVVGPTTVHVSDF